MRPTGTRWALAGRNPDKLARRARAAGRDRPRVRRARAAACRRRRRRRRCARSRSPPASSRRRPGRTCASASRSSPPAPHAGTDYADLTGEPEFVDRMYVRHHAEAVATGARLVHACGFDSVPHDLGALFTVQQLPEDVPLVGARLRARRRPGRRRARSTRPSTRSARLRQAGTRAPRAPPNRAAARERRVSSVKDRARYERSLGAWALPLPTLDPQVVKRSAAALERYGPDFAYGHYAAVKRLPVALGAVGARRRSVRALAAAAGALMAAGTDAVGRRPVARAARALLVQRPLHRRGRRPARRDRGRRRRPRLRRDGEDARRSRRSAWPSTSCRRAPARSPRPSRWATR